MKCIFVVLLFLMYATLSSCAQAHADDIGDVIQDQEQVAWVQSQMSCATPGYIDLRLYENKPRHNCRVRNDYLAMPTPKQEMQQYAKAGDK